MVDEAAVATGDLVRGQHVLPLPLVRPDAVTRENINRFLFFNLCPCMRMFPGESVV